MLRIKVSPMTAMEEEIKELRKENEYLRKQNASMTLMTHEVFAKVMENLEAVRTVRAAGGAVIKMLPTDASDELKTAIGDILQNEEEELDLRYNNISDEGAKALAEALKVTTTYQTKTQRRWRRR